MKKFEITKSELFKHPKFGYLRVLTDENGDPWFVGKAIAETLGYRLPQKAITDHVLSKDRKVLKYKTFSKTSTASQIWSDKDFSDKQIINESGVYSLIFGSRLPSAFEFKHWVTSEVLPQIRRTGGYIPTHDEDSKPLSDLEIMSLAIRIGERILTERNRKIAEQDATLYFPSF